MIKKLSILLLLLIISSNLQAGETSSLLSKPGLGAFKDSPVGTATMIDPDQIDVVMTDAEVIFIGKKGAMLHPDKTQEVALYYMGAEILVGNNGRNGTFEPLGITKDLLSKKVALAAYDREKGVLYPVYFESIGDGSYVWQYPNGAQIPVASITTVGGSIAQKQDLQ